MTTNSVNAVIKFLANREGNLHEIAAAIDMEPGRTSTLLGGLLRSGTVVRSGRMRKYVYRLAQGFRTPEQIYQARVKAVQAALAEQRRLTFAEVKNLLRESEWITRAFLELACKNGDLHKQGKRGFFLTFQDYEAYIEESTRRSDAKRRATSAAYGERPGQQPRVLQLEKPLGTVTAGGGKFGLVAANLVKHFGGNYSGPGAAMDAPAHTVTTTDHHGLVTSHLVKLRGTCRDGQRTNEPMPTITAGGLHVGEVETMLAVESYDEQRADQVLAFLREYCGADSDGLVTVDGIVYRIVDIGMRMLQPHELYRAQGFPEWYIIDRDYRGVKYAKDKQVARCGNAVPPPFAEALVRANLPNLCKEKELAA